MDKSGNVNKSPLTFHIIRRAFITLLSMLRRGGVEAEQRAEVRGLPRVQDLIRPHRVHDVGRLRSERVFFQEDQISGRLISTWLLLQFGSSFLGNLDRHQSDRDANVRRFGSLGRFGCLGQGRVGRASTVDVVHVVFELVLAFEGGAAVRAAERAHLRVDDHVLGQSFLDAEGLVADHTAVRLLSWLKINTRLIGMKWNLSWNYSTGLQHAR